MNRFLTTIIILNTLFFVGCDIKNLNNTSARTLTLCDVNQLIGIRYDDIDRIYGIPEKSTYYINLSNLSSQNINNLTLRDINYFSTIKASYNINNDDSYIVLWYKDNKVIKSSFGKVSNPSTDCLNSYIDETDIKIDFNKNSSTLPKDLDNYNSYINTSLSNFINDYNLDYPKISIDLLNKNKSLYIYDIYNKTNNYIIVLSYNNQIYDIKFIKSSKIYDLIFKYIKKEN